MDIIERLRIIDPEKLTELCCMHLSFTLDLHDDEFASLFNAKCETKNKKNYFYRKLKDKPSCDSMPLTHESISHIYQVIEYLGRDINITHEGLFRKTGSLSRQQELKAFLSTGKTIDFTTSQYSIDDCACVVKSFLADLPEPLLTEAHYSAHCQIANMVTDDMPAEHKKHVFHHQLKSLRLLLLLLPKVNYCLLKYLLLLLCQVKIAYRKNLMTSQNLATVFAPQILCPRKWSPEQMKENFTDMVKAVSFLIENATLLFEPPVELIQDASMYLNNFQIHSPSQGTDTEAVKTAISFCERTNAEELNSVNYTQKALAELQTYIQHLPNSARKRKLIKKFQSENSKETNNENRKKHVRSRSVGEAIKRHLWKNKAKDGFHKNYHHTSYDMLSSTSPANCSATQVSSKAKSVEALNLHSVSNSSATQKSNVMSKNWLRASRKIKAWQS